LSYDDIGTVCGRRIDRTMLDAVAMRVLDADGQVIATAELHDA